MGKIIVNIVNTKTGSKSHLDVTNESKNVTTITIKKDGELKIFEIDGVYADREVKFHLDKLVGDHCFEELPFLLRNKLESLGHAPNEIPRSCGS